MKRLGIAAILICSCAIAQEQATDFTGNWKIHMSVMGNDSDQQCVFTQKAAVVTGTCKNDQGTDQTVYEGKVDGKTLTWSVKGDYNGSPLTISYRGTLDGDSLIGSVAVDPYGVTGDFKGTKSK